MKVFVLILVVFLSGCELFEEECRTYCEDDVLHECTNDGGLMGGKDNWSHVDCKKNGMICLERDYGAGCMFYSEKCDGSKEYFCKDNSTIFYCLQYEGEFYENYSDDCYFESEVCVEFSSNALCLIPVDECDPDTKSVCLNKDIGKCHEYDSNFYFERVNFCQDSYGQENKCIYNPDTKTAHCLR